MLHRSAHRFHRQVRADCLLARNTPQPWVVNELPGQNLETPLQHRQDTKGMRNRMRYKVCSAPTEPLENQPFDGRAVLLAEIRRLGRPLWQREHP